MEIEPSRRRYVLGFYMSEFEVLLIKKSEDSKMFPGLIHGIGGELYPEEAPIEGMRREFAEETGLREEEGARIQWKIAGTMTSPCSAIHVFHSFVHSAEYSRIRREVVGHETSEGRILSLPPTRSLPETTLHLPALVTLLQTPQMDSFHLYLK